MTLLATLTLFPHVVQVARRWLAFIAQPRCEPDAQLAAMPPARLLARVLLLATPLALLAAAVGLPLAEHAQIESDLDFSLGWREAIAVVLLAPLLEEILFRGPLGRRATFERAVVNAALVALAAWAILSAGRWAKVDWAGGLVLAAALAATPLALLWANALFERHRLPALPARDDRYARLYPWLAHASVLLFAVVHAANYTWPSAAGLTLLPLLVLPQWILGHACLFVRVQHGVGAAIALHMAHNAIAYALVALAW